MICSDYAWKESVKVATFGVDYRWGRATLDNARRLATQLIQLQPAANDAATISRFSASGHDRLRFAPGPSVSLCGATRTMEDQKNGVMEQRTPTVELYQGDLQS